MSMTGTRLATRSIDANNTFTDRVQMAGYFNISISGSAKQWVDAGKLQPVRFTRGVLILGKQGDMD